MFSARRDRIETLAAPRQPALFMSPPPASAICVGSAASFDRGDIPRLLLRLARPELLHDRQRSPVIGLEPPQDLLDLLRDGPDRWVLSQRLDPRGRIENQ